MVEGSEVGSLSASTKEGAPDDSIVVGVVICLLVNCTVRTVTQTLVANGLAMIF